MSSGTVAKLKLKLCTVPAVAQLIPNWNTYHAYLLRGSSIWISNVLILDHGGRHHDLPPTQILHSDDLDLMFVAVGERRRRRQILEGFKYERNRLIS